MKMKYNSIKYGCIYIDIVPTANYYPHCSFARSWWLTFLKSHTKDLKIIKKCVVKKINLENGKYNSNENIIWNVRPFRVKIVLGPCLRFYTEWTWSFWLLKNYWINEKNSLKKRYLGNFKVPRDFPEIRDFTTDNRKLLQCAGSRE